MLSAREGVVPFRAIKTKKHLFEPNLKRTTQVCRLKLCLFWLIFLILKENKISYIFHIVASTSLFFHQEKKKQKYKKRKSASLAFAVVNLERIGSKHLTEKNTTQKTNLPFVPNRNQTYQLANDKVQQQKTAPYHKILLRFPGSVSGWTLNRARDFLKLRPAAGTTLQII